jgi:hypothetical protein
MKEVVAAAIFFLVTLAVFSKAACPSPGQPLAHQIASELRAITRLR